MAVKAYGSTNRKDAKFPDKNFKDIVPIAAAKDNFDYMILSVPSIDITNLDTATTPV